jgi:hypothetical protein
MWILAILLIMLSTPFTGAPSPGYQAKSDPANLPFLISDDFENGRAEYWTANIPAHWQVAKEEGSFVYQLTAPGKEGPVRAPTSWSLLKDFDVSSFVLAGHLKCKSDISNKHRDMCVFFHFQDPTHFYYVHFAATSDEAHNIIAIVNGKDRVKISHELPGGSISRLLDLNFHDFKVTGNAETGEIKAYLDDMNTPLLTATDKTLQHGLMGVGSFDDTGSFDDIRLWGLSVKTGGGKDERKK